MLAAWSRLLGPGVGCKPLRAAAALREGPKSAFVRGLASAKNGDGADQNLAKDGSKNGSAKGTFLPLDSQRSRYDRAMPVHETIQGGYMRGKDAHGRPKTLSLDSKLRVMRLLETIEKTDKDEHDLFAKRFAQFKNRSQLDYQEFLLADLDGDGRVSNAEWEEFLRKKALVEAGLSFKEPSALSIEIPMSIQQFTRMADENEGLHVSVNGMRYRLSLQPEGRTADVIEHKQERLHDTLVELASMEKEKRPLDSQAARHTRRVLTVCLMYLLSQAAVIAKLTFFSRFGWDVMEPITYFITFGTAIMGLVFFQYHKIEYSYPALAALLTQRRANKLYERNGFDFSRYTELQSLALKYERQLLVLQPPRSLWPPSALAENDRILAILNEDMNAAQQSSSTDGSDPSTATSNPGLHADALHNDASNNVNNSKNN